MNGNGTDAIRSDAHRELDARVAETVFGWRWYTWVESGERSLFAEPPEEYPVREVARALGWPENPGHRYVPSAGDEPIGCNAAPEYSTDIAAAWKVVEKLKERHLVWLFAGPDDESCEHWTCRLREFGYRPFQDREWEATADTAPLAICRAATAAPEDR